MFLRRIITYPDSFCRIGKSKCIGVSFRTAGVIVGTFVLCRTAETYFFGEVLSDYDAVIIQIGLNLRMVISCQRNFEIRICFTNHLQGLLHHFHRTFIHCNSTDIEPSFFFQVLGERRKHCYPHFFVSLLARCCFHKFQRVSCLVVILE